LSHYVLVLSSLRGWEDIFALLLFGFGVRFLNLSRNFIILVSILFATEIDHKFWIPLPIQPHLRAIDFKHVWQLPLRRLGNIGALYPSFYRSYFHLSLNKFKNKSLSNVAEVSYDGTSD
jgi:hypothetical protein